MANEKRLIDANALFKAIKEDKVAWRFGVPNTLKLLFDWLRIIIKEQPTVEAVEVVHAYWTGSRFNPMTDEYEEYCSRCCAWSSEYGKPYCPNCGAKMDGGNEDG